MLREPVGLSLPARRIALDSILFALHFHKVEVIVAAVTDHHFHILARFPDREPRKWSGIAKKESARALAKASLVPPGGVWAVRSHCKPITHREHQLSVANYIAEHEKEGGVVWAIWRESPPRSP